MKMSLLFFSGDMLYAISRTQPVQTIQEPAVHQIVITEIMADPNPCVMLPDAEYIELYNRGSSAVDLKDWQIELGSHKKVLATARMDPGEYLIVCDGDHESLLRVFGRTLPVRNMPAVVNTGQTITLKSPNGAVIHTVTFSDGWYQNRQKSQGGWSIEIIDPDNPCGYSENWSESLDIRGGTPGQKNSTDASRPDLSLPVLLRATLPSDSSVLLLFSERMDSSTILSPWLYSADKGLMHPSAVVPVGPDYNAVLLYYAERFQTSTSYTLTVLNTLKDCAGNTLTPDAVVHFAVSGMPEKDDIVINEILFNPRTGNSEFIELYNRSSRALNLENLAIALADSHSGEIKRTVSLKKYPYLLFPGNYVVITDHAISLPENCIRQYPASIVEINGLFALPDEEGFLVLFNEFSRAIDEVRYAASMHTEFLQDAEGVSLERTDFDKPSGSPQNWHSASTASGYSTPCRMNSQAMHEDIPPAEVILSPQVFSPDNDGVDDQMILHIQTHEPGCSASILIFDMNGRKIRNLTSRILLGTDEYFTWDGISDEHEPADPGIFIFYIEICSPMGKVKKIKKVVTLTRR
jgi:hypothetical protein